MELVKIIKGQPMTTSRKVAEKFGKSHKTITRIIKNLECTDEFNRRNFAPIEFYDARNRKQTEYLITKDGFAFLVMGFTGKQAALFKEQYIAAFNEARRKPSPMEMVMQSMAWLSEKVEEQRKQLEVQKKELTVAKPKVEYHDEVLKSKSTYTTTQIAAELNMSARKLNAALYVKGVQRKVRGQWVLYAKHLGKGYTNTYTHAYGDKSRQHTVWTEEGRKFILSLFQEGRQLRIA